MVVNPPHVRFYAGVPQSVAHALGESLRVEIAMGSADTIPVSISIGLCWRQNGVVETE